MRTRDFGPLSLPKGRAIASLVVAVAAAAAPTSAQTPAPLRHLVYAFTYESLQHGNAPKELDDVGTMTVDVLREAPDHGLVVVVTQQGEYVRHAPATTCAVYGNTVVVCDSNKPVNPEEFTLLRFLGANFYDPKQIDAKQQWSVADRRGARSMTAEYTIVNDTGSIMEIAEKRRVEDTARDSLTIRTQAKLTYDSDRQLPLTIEAYAVADQHIGISGVSTSTYQISFDLLADSMAQ
jgi:hypothetical protein